MIASFHSQYFALLYLSIILKSSAEQPPSKEEESSSCRATAADELDCDVGGSSPIVSSPSIQKSPSKGSNPEICSLYLAPSSIPNAGYGTYTTKPFKQYDEIFSSGTASVIVPDLDRNQPPGTDYSGHSIKGFSVFDYLWQPYGAGCYEGTYGHDWEPTPLGSLANFHPYLVNFAHHGNDHRYDDTMTSRFTDPGAGAFSYHKSFAMGASRNIEAGEELFADYGEGYLDSRSHEEVYRGIPREDDFNLAATVAATIAGEPIVSTASIKRVVELLSNGRTAALLPDDPSTYAKYRNMTTEQIAFDFAWRTVQRRSIDWIVENGKCLDNIDVRRSTIPQAGRGAFVSRRIPKGEMIVPATLVHITDKNTLKMYNFTTQLHTGKKARIKEESIGTQMLLNYCFGHRESTVLLCPATSSSAINHCSTRTLSGGQCGEDGPNAAYRLPKDWSPETKEWLQLSVEELRQKDGRGIVLEVYATRDIEVGDEIFFDYGAGWERSWQNHVGKWAPPGRQSALSSYGSITVMNENKAPLRSRAELETNPYPANVITGCYYTDDYEESDYEFWDERDDWKKLSDEMILKYFSDNGEDFTWYESLLYPRYWPCDIISGNDEEGYLVQIFQLPQEDDTVWTKKGVPVFLTNFPRESIRFFNRLGTSDQYLPGAFRHHLELSDAIFPEQWKNLKEVEVSS